MSFASMLGCVSGRFGAKEGKESREGKSSEKGNG